MDRMGASRHSYPSVQGVSVLIAKNVLFEPITLLSDRQGRYLILHATLQVSQILLLACYVPPPYSSEVVNKGLAFISQYPGVPAVWMGDFNMTMTPALDRLAPSIANTDESQHTRLYGILADFALIDIWRHRYPTTKAYSCFSASHNTMSHIDFILISKTLLPKVTGTGFTPRILSDHAPCWMQVSLLKPPPHFHLETKPILAISFTRPENYNCRIFIFL